MTTLQSVAQRLDADSLVTLFELDATKLGDVEIRRFTSNVWADRIVYFDGNPYTPIDMEANGFEWQGQGAPPTPSLRIANTNRVIGALANDFDDLVGATVRRLRTYKMFLDDGDAPDPEMQFQVDVFRVERKTTQNKIFIEFELAAAFDQEGRQLPSRIMLRDVCTHVYRRWTGSGFDYTKATCPYVAARYFLPNGNETSNAASDRCGKRLSDCLKRFGNNPLPTRAFPGLARTRV